MLPSARGKCGSEGAKWGCNLGGNQDAILSRFAPTPRMMSVNTQKSSAPPSRAPIAIAGEIHRQILIRGVPSDEEMSGYRRSPEHLRGAQGDLNYKCMCSWHGKFHAWALITLFGHSVCCAPSPMPRRKHDLLMALLRGECQKVKAPRPPPNPGQ